MLPFGDEWFRQMTVEGENGLAIQPGVVLYDDEVAVKVELWNKNGFVIAAGVAHGAIGNGHYFCACRDIKFYAVMRP